MERMTRGEESAAGDSRRIYRLHKKMQKTHSVFFILIITIIEKAPHGFVYLHLQVTQACLLVYPVETKFSTD